MSLGLSSPYSTPYQSPGYNPLSYSGAQAIGQQTAATAGEVVQLVAAPVVGFASGALQGRAGLIIGAAVIAFVLYQAHNK